MSYVPPSGIERVRATAGVDWRGVVLTGLAALLYAGGILAAFGDERRAEQALLVGGTVLVFARAFSGRSRPLAVVLGSAVAATIVLGAASWLEAGQAPPDVALERVAVDGAWLMLALVLSAFGAKRLSLLRRDRERLRHYRIVRRLGAGAMSDVFEAEHPLLRCRVALAVVRTPPEQIRSPARFARAMELAAGLDHPAIVRVFEHGVTAEGTPFCVMELVRGVSLSRAIEVGGPMPEGRVVHLMRQLCGGLAHVHGQRLVHRDVKPSNVLIVRDGFDLVKLIDLDLLSPAAERGQSGSVRADGARDADELERVLDSPTPIGAPAAPVRGTPLFLAPEAILDPDGIDARADVYALGALAYLLLTGEAPLPSGSIGRAIERQLHDVPEPPSARIGRELSTDLETLVLECLAKQPEARPRDTAALEARLAACVDADAWTYGEARAWWAQHAAALEPQPGVAAGEAVLIVPR